MIIFVKNKDKMAKKKVNQAQQQKLLSVQHRKTFMQKLRRYCIMMGDESMFDLIPEYLRNIIYDNRGVSCKINVEEGAKVTKRFVKILYAHINEQVRWETIEILPDSHRKVNLFDYFQVLFPLEGVLRQESDRAHFKGEEQFRELRDASLENIQTYNRKIIYIIYCACYAFCDLSKRCLYTFTYNLKNDSLDRNCGDLLKRQLVTIGTLPLDERHVKINGEWRPVCLVGEVRHNYNISTIEPAEVLLRRLRIPGAEPDEKAPVYIQQHAVERIMKRAYCTFPGTVGSLVFKAFSNKRRIISSGKNRYLIECYYEDVKIGYFSAVYVDGILVILTFLLITHSGTPEGKKLEQLTGLQKSDHIYLAMDDLRSLANSDIIYNDDVQKIFIEAGCESLLELCRRVQFGFEYDWLWETETQSKNLSKMIREYIRLGADDEDYFVNGDS
jgi:hypothetical protein